MESIGLFVFCFTRFRFDELHYGKFINHYLKNVFFFDFHPPLGKQLIASVAYLTGYNGNSNYTFTHIGKEYSEVSSSACVRAIWN